MSVQMIRQPIGRPLLVMIGTLALLDIRGFPKIDHSGIDARIVLEQNKFSKKRATSDRT